MLGNIFSEKEQNALPELPVSFVLSPQKQLKVGALYDDSLKAWKYYSHHITRFPLDLRAHAQRLFLSLDNGLKAFLAGAIQDLFIALGDNGADLRRKMLELVKPELETKDIAYFEVWLSTGKRKDFSYKAGSVLDQGLPGESQKLVVPTEIEEEEVASYGNAVEEAQACLEYGQVEEAQKILEEELTRNSQDVDVAQELLNIYQYTRDRSSLESTTEKLLAAGVELSEDWQQVQIESQDW